jgi:hypothetical protein
VAEDHGSFVVVWESYDGNHIRGQRYRYFNAPTLGELLADSSGSSRTPAVAKHDDQIVIAWAASSASGSDTSGLSVQASGHSFVCAIGCGLPQEQINLFSLNNQRFPAIAGRDDFLIVWASDNAFVDTSGQAIKARFFDTSTGAVGGEFLVNVYTTGAQTFPDVAVSENGDFVVVWHSIGGSAGSDSSLSSIQGRRFDSSGAPLGGEFQVNTYTTGNQVFPSVAYEPGGNFVVAWESDGGPGTDSNKSIQARIYDAAGAPLGSQFQVNTYTTGGQYQPAVAARGDGRFVVAWQSGVGDGSGYGVFGQRLVVPTTAPTVVDLAVVYEDPVVVAGPLSLGLGALPTAVEATFRFVSPGFPPPLGVPVTPTVLAASLSLGDARATLSDLTSFSVTFAGSPATISGLSYSFGPMDTATSTDGIQHNDFELHVEGVDKATGQPFEYRYDRSSETPAPVAAPACPPVPSPGCLTGFAKGLLSVDERTPGAEKLLVKWTGGPTLLGTDFGNPLPAGGTAYKVCVYDDGDALAGAYAVDRAGHLCGSGPCWKALGKAPGDPAHKGYRYKDAEGAADGLLLVRLKGGTAARSTAVVKGKSIAPATLPTGVAAALAGSTGATVQLFGSDATACLSVGLPTVVRDDGTFFRAKGP